jgi:hypothetical protein
MLKKTLFLGFLILITFLVVSEAAVYGVNFGLVDYFNILFCNTISYPLYGRTVWNLLNLFYFIIVMVAGITVISHSINISSRGIRSMEILRYEKSSRYLSKFVRKNVLLSLQYFSAIAISIMISIMLTCKSLILSGSLYNFHSSYTAWVMTAVYVVKILIIFSLVSLWLLYLILDHKYEFLLVISIVLVSMLLFLDLVLGSSFVTLTYSTVGLIYPIGYLISYVISFVFIQKKYKEKELW